MNFARNAILLALCSSAAAFTLPKPATAPATVLESSRYNEYDDIGIRSSSGARELRRTSSPLARVPARYPDGSSSALTRPRPGPSRGYRDMLATENIQGGALKTWSFPDPNVDSCRSS
jgi:hypothetical protein